MEEESRIINHKQNDDTLLNPKVTPLVNEVYIEPTVNRVYNDRGNIIEVTDTDLGSKRQRTVETTYEYDDKGNITEKIYATFDSEGRRTGSRWETLSNKMYK